MDYRSLGDTGLAISAVAMGCWTIVGDANWGSQDERDSLDTIHAALDAGVTSFDTAESYGDGYSEELLGKALEGRRSQALIATKVSADHLTAEGIAAACTASLRRLRTDYIDLYQIHWPSRSIPLAESIGALELLREQGKIRAYGVCNFGTGDLADLLPIARPATNQLPYSLLWRAIEYGIQQQCAGHAIGILCYSPLMQGLLTGKFATADDVPAPRARTRHFSSQRPYVRHGQPGFETGTFAALDRIRAIASQLGAPMADVALAWLLQRPAVASVLAGARTPEQIQRNARAVELQLPAEAITALDAATDAIKQHFGADPDMWSAESRFR